MKCNLTFIAILATFLAGCAVTKDIPSKNDAGISLFGSHASISLKNIPTISGELIEVDTGHITIMPRYPVKSKAEYFLKSNHCLTIPLDTVQKISVIYARDYGSANASIALPFLSLTHGYFAAITFPINIIASIVIASGSAYAFHMQDTFDVEKLKMFARFPGGLPPNVKLEDLQSGYKKKK